MFGRIHLWSCLVLDFHLLGIFWLLIQFHHWLLVCSYNLFLTDSVLRDCTFLGIYPFLLGCPFYWYITVHDNLLWPFVFLCCQCNFSFISDFVYLGPLSVSFFMSLVKGLLVLLIFSKHQLLVYLIYLIVFLVPILKFYFFIYLSICSLFLFPSTNFRFYLFFFSASFCCKVRLFIWDSSCFLRYASMAIKFPLTVAFAVPHRFQIVVFPFSLSQGILWFFFFFFSMTHWLYTLSCCLDAPGLCFFAVFVL